PGKRVFEQVKNGVIAFRHSAGGPLREAPPIASIFEEALQAEFPTGVTKLFAVIISVGATTSAMPGTLRSASEKHCVRGLVEEGTKDIFSSVKQVRANPNLMHVFLRAVAPYGRREIPKCSAATLRIQNDHNGGGHVGNEFSQHLPCLFQAPGCSRSAVA